MPSTNEDLARVIGFLNPKIIVFRLKRGEKFKTQGVTASGSRYELRYEIQDFDRETITLTMNGEWGNNRIMNVALGIPLVPNQPIGLHDYIDIGQAKFYIAFIAPSASQFHPIAGAKFLLAYGDVRNTVPPPPPKG